MRHLIPTATAMALLAVGIPVLRGQNPEADKERALIAIRKLGGKVEVDAGRVDRPVIMVNLGTSDVTDLQLACLSAFPHLRILGLNVTQVSDAGLGHLKSLSDLQVLDLGLTAVTDAGMSHLQSMRKLQLLNLSATRVGDLGLSALQELSSLEGLDVSFTR